MAGFEWSKQRQGDGNVIIKTGPKSPGRGTFDEIVQTGKSCIGLHDSESHYGILRSNFYFIILWLIRNQGNFAVMNSEKKSMGKNKKFKHCNKKLFFFMCCHKRENRLT